MWLDTMPDDSQYRPRAERVSFDMAIRCRWGDARCSVVLRNLTTGGARIEGLGGVLLGDALVLMLPSLKPKRARVVWIDGDAAGLEFEHPLHPDVFETLVLRHAQWRTRDDTDRADHRARVTEVTVPKPAGALGLLARPLQACLGAKAAA